jgi:hypothetical protein
MACFGVATLPRHATLTKAHQKDHHCSHHRHYQLKGRRGVQGLALRHEAEAAE